MFRRFARISLVFALIAASSVAAARTWVVRPDGTGDVATIRDAVVRAADWDVIELTDGVFTGFGNRDIETGTRWLIIRSQSGDPEACVIDVQGTSDEHHRGLVFGLGG